MATNSTPTVIQWVLDTRSLWPSALQTQNLSTVASRALALLPKDEQANVLRYFHVRDAKLALGSILLKRYAISRFCNLAWDQATPVRDERTKPVFRLPDGSQPLIFNVSHQAGLVVLFAVHNPPPGVSVGVDVVCPSERRTRDHETLTKEGWAHFVDMHSEVFGKDEVTTLEELVAERTEDGRDYLLRHFYALWCLREAYVKMTGEALLASWLGDLEMRGFAPPEGKQTPQEVWFKGSRLDGVNVKLTPLLGDYMVSTATRKGDGGEELEIGEFINLDIEEVLSFAENADGLQ